LTFNHVILIIPETLEKKEEVMKKVFLLLAVLLVVLPLSARSKLEFSPRGSLYISSVNFGVGLDLIVNPKKPFGLRVNLAEVVFGDNTAFSLNSGNLFSFSTFDILYYTNVADIFSYVDLIFGLYSAEGGTTIAIGGGLGLEKYMKKGNYIFLEPALIFKDGPATDGDLTFRTSFGLKLGM
jgi:hypothetical protein